MAYSETHKYILLNCKNSPCSTFSLGQLEFSRQLLGRDWELAQSTDRQFTGGHCSENNAAS